MTDVQQQQPEPSATGGEKVETDFPLRFCTVCASNQNRSMEAHLSLSLSHYPTISFGTGSLVRLPGPSIDKPNVYNFNSTTYNEMYNQLSAADKRLYTQNGLLNMLNRNRHIKERPERFQDWKVGVPRTDPVVIEDGTDDQGRRIQPDTEVKDGVVDVIFCCEERCWDAVVEDLNNRASPLSRPVHVINVDIRDNHEEAIVGGRGIRDLADMLTKVAREEQAKERELAGTKNWTTGFDERVPDVVAEWQEKWPGLPALWTVCYF